MTDKEAFEKARTKAVEALALYKAGMINYGELEEAVHDYRELFNRQAAEIAAKYGMKPKKFRMSSFLRYGVRR